MTFISIEAISTLVLLKVISSHRMESLESGVELGLDFQWKTSFIEMIRDVNTINWNPRLNQWEYWFLTSQVEMDLFPAFSFWVRTPSGSLFNLV